MIALLSVFRLVPSWCYWLLALVALCLGCELHGRHSVQAKWDAAVVAQKAADDAQIEIRNESNRMEARAQADRLTTIQKAHDDELVKVRSSIAGQRLRVGTALCPAAGSTDTASTSGGTGTDTGGGLVSENVQRAINDLEVKVESALAAGRAAQAFIRENGMAPN
jgi:hypothetical protein